jgi:rSAM/selenodomain-associated transferase 1
MNKDCTLIIFAKAPVPGLAKTRLVPALGADGAARLAARMLATTVQRALEAGIGPVELCCAPDASHSQFRQLAHDHGIALSSQGEGDLGARMHRAFERVLKRHSQAILIGTDSPDLGASALRDASDALIDHPAVFAPATDGGYVLIGLTRPMPSLFQDIAWSTSQVMQQTRQRLTQFNVDAHELPTRRDIDEPDDLVHLPMEWRE